MASAVAGSQGHLFLEGGQGEEGSVVSSALPVKDDVRPKEEDRSILFLQDLLEKCANLRCIYKAGERAEDRDNTSALAQFLQQSATYKKLVRQIFKQQ